MSATAEDRTQALRRYLAARGSREREEKPGRERLGPRPAGEPRLLSFGQEQLWTHEQLVPGGTIYNEASTIRRRGPLDDAVFERAFAEIVRRHEIWRTTFSVVGGVPVPVVHESMAIPIVVLDLRDAGAAATADGAADRAVAAAEAQARKPYDLERGPLVRVTVCHLSEDEHLIYMALHHIVFDGVSIYAIFLREIAALYDAFAAGEPSPLPEPALQYADFAAWQRRTFAEERRRRDLDAAARRLQGVPRGVDVGHDRPRPVRPRYRGGEEHVFIPADVRDTLGGIARQAGTTLFVALAGLYAVLLQRYSGRDELLIGTVGSIRKDPRLEGLIGFFLNTLVLRADLRATGADGATEPGTGDPPSFRQLLRRLRAETIDALSHDEVPFPELVAALGRRGETGANPLFDALLVLEPQTGAAPAGWSVEPYTVGTEIARLDLNLQLEDRPEGVTGSLRYDRDLFDASTAERMARHIEALAHSIVADPDRPVTRLPLDPDGSIAARFAAAGNAVRPPEPPPDLRVDVAPAGSLVDAFDLVAARFGDRPAVIGDGSELTHAELNLEARRVARGLQRAGSGRVALLVGHDGATVAAMLGALRAGRAYVPLDPAHPAARLGAILDDSEATAILTDRAHLAQAKSIAGGRAILEIESLEAGSSEHERYSCPDDAEAYLLYTSGSTGRPKGVVQSRAGLRYFGATYVDALRLHAGDRMSFIPSNTFDAAVMDIYGALLSGAALVPFDVAALGPRGLAAAISRHGITVYHSVPTIFRYLVGVARPDELRSVRIVVLGGEAVRVSDLEAFRRLFPETAEFVNLFGSTESSLGLQYFADRRTASRAAVPIGWPVAGTTVTLLDAQGQPTDMRGEVALTSRHVALGYWKRSEQTAAAFDDNPDGTRTYRTGDLGRRLADGSFEHLGRRDLQVKVRGVRVEVPEVEAALLQVPSIAESAVAAAADDDGEFRLAAYLVPKAGTTIDLVAVRESLRDRLPDAMVPTVFAVVDALPLTRTGKVDRAALAHIETVAPRVAADRAPDDFESRMIEVWSAVLRTDVGLNDDFFDLGGHSFLAARLVDRLAGELGIHADLPTLMECRTVARLAAAVRTGPSPSSQVVAIQPAGTQRPIFIAPGAGARLLYLRHLARRLGQDQPLYALYSRDPADIERDESIEEMAARNVTHLRTIQPHGPYRLLGYSFGGVVAYETARQLSEQGEEIELLALVDAALPNGRSIQTGFHPQYVPRRVRNQLAILRRLSPPEGRTYLRNRLRIVRRNSEIHARNMVERRVPGLPDRIGWRDPEGEDERRWLARDKAAWPKYRARPFAGRILLLSALHHQRPPEVDDTRTAWAELAAGGIEVRTIPGSHLTVLLEPLVRFVAEELRRALRC